MRAYRLVLICFLVCGSAIVLTFAASGRRASTAAPAPPPSATYLGFDLNIYPGDDALPILRKTFSFTSYWLGAPPGEKRSTWQGKRELLASQGFGFVVLHPGGEPHPLRLRLLLPPPTWVLTSISILATMLYPFCAKHFPSPVTGLARLQARRAARGRANANCSLRKALDL